ncbi:hypothetical protein FRX31_003629 [Thalictrum thalictroides]|uniref:Uncharacterized protein n=1 Tax=Thalictrum thalictroides TaxID=46969 RepID=A0A7J6XEK6_THATH|nr:hypothetical protein FRX31_003629 [Thalictrum thalictroides]
MTEEEKLLVQRQHWFEKEMEIVSPRDEILISYLDCQPNILSDLNVYLWDCSMSLTRLNMLPFVEIKSLCKHTVLDFLPQKVCCVASNNRNGLLTCSFEVDQIVFICNMSKYKMSTSVLSIW